MITIISSAAREREALANFIETQGWPGAVCTNLRAYRRLAEQTPSRVIVTRHRLDDGYSDEILEGINGNDDPFRTSVIVLMPATASSAEEADQVRRGATCVLRDPVRFEVLAAYASRGLNRKEGHSSAGTSVPIRILVGGAELTPHDRTLQYRNRRVALTPKEVALARLLIEFEGRVVTYETLYSEVLGRAFRGDTSNMRVLLGKLCASADAAGIDLRKSVKVIPKAGYQYFAPHSAK